MEEIHNAIEIEDFDFYDDKPAGERWAPVGANDLDDETACDIQHSSRYVCIHKPWLKATFKAICLKAF